MDSLAHFRTHSRFSDPGCYGALVEELPGVVRELVRIVQGMVIYDVMAGLLYGHNLSPAQRDMIHLRHVEAMLDTLLTMSDAPLDEPRPHDKRLAGRCHHYNLLLVSLLRAKGIPARERGGFGTYFNAPRFEDHWVAEYWSGTEQRWVMVDAQLDKVWMSRLTLVGDPLDLSRDDFILAADAWKRCRFGGEDPDLYGISFANLQGLWFILGSLIRDAAALNGHELLPWDIWGAMPRPGTPLDPSLLKLGDRLAGLCAEPDVAAVELSGLYETDERIRVPATLFNALTNRMEPIKGEGAAL